MSKDKNHQASFQFYISYARDDETLYKSLYQHLSPLKQGRSINLWDTHRSTPAGSNRTMLNDEYIKKAQIILLLVSASYLSNEDCQNEKQKALQRQREGHNVKVVSILLRDCLWDTDSDFKETIILPKVGVAIDKWPQQNDPGRKIADDAGKNIAKELNLIMIQHFSQTPFSSKEMQLLSQQTVDLSNPYVGLRPFEFHESHYFYGRKNLTEKTIRSIGNCLRQQKPENKCYRLLSVIGPSGSGKSSLVQAGVLPGLLQRGRGGILSKSPSWIFLDTITPGYDPLLRIAATLQPHLPSYTNNREIQNILMSSEYGLRILTNEILHNSRKHNPPEPPEYIFMVIDQFEEAFTQTSANNFTAFLDRLIVAATDPDSRLITIIVLRADFYDKLLDLPDKYRELGKFLRQNKVEVESIEIDKIEEIIIEPARQAKMRFEPEVIDNLLKDVNNQKHALPLLQFSLQSLHQESNGTDITMQEYKKLGNGGGIRGILKKHVNETYQSLSPEEKMAAQLLFLKLITINTDDRKTIMRRDVSLLSCLEGLSKSRRRIMQNTIDKFIKARLITIDSDPDILGSGTIMVLRISHEALLSEWDLLKKWCQEKDNEIYYREEVRLRTNEWLQINKTQKLLYRGYDLNRLQKLYKQNLLEKSQIEFYIKSNQRSWRIKGAYILLAVVIIISAFLTYNYTIRTSAQPSLLVVTTLSDDIKQPEPGSLRFILEDNKLSDGDTITFADHLTGQEIILQADLFIYKNITIKGNNATIDINNITEEDKSSFIKIRGQNRNKIYISPNHIVTFSSLSFTENEVAYHGFIVNDGHLTIENCILYKNIAEYNGGILFNANGTMFINNSWISENKANGNGGAIYNERGLLTITNTKISNNQALRSGGAIYSLLGHVIILGSIIEENTAGDSKTYNKFGGGIYMQNSRLSLLHSSIINNTVDGHGGGIAIAGESAILERTLITGNTAINGSGGGLLVAKNTANNRPATVEIRFTDYPDNREPASEFYIGKNKLSSTNGNLAPNIYPDISGTIINNNPHITVINNINSPVTGNPPPTVNLPENNKGIYLGTLDIDRFCQQQRGFTPEDLQTQENPKQRQIFSRGETYILNTSLVTCIPYSSSESTPGIPRHFPAKNICKDQFPDQGNHLIDRLADFYDHSSWQCYKDVEKVDIHVTNIDGLNRFCKEELGYARIYENTKKNAYDWNCEDEKGNIIGISITDLCRFLVNDTENVVFDRLANYDDPDGWECWRPKQ